MRAILLVAALYAFSANADVVTDLLDLPPLMLVTVKEQQAVRTAPAPDDDLDRVARYWSIFHPDEQPSEAIRERLLETLEKAPRSVPDVVDNFPVREDVCVKLKPFVKEETVSHWMALHCASERERLVTLASLAGDPSDMMEHSDELETL